MLYTGLLDHEPQTTDIPLDHVWTASTVGAPEDCGDLSIDWQGSLGNDEYGCCFFASGGHEYQALSHLAGRERKFTAEGVLASYAQYLGVEHLTRANDRGTMPGAGAAFRRKTGIIDANGHPAHIGAYVFDESSDYDKLAKAIYDFGAIEFCFTFPASAMEAFERGDYVWDYVPGSAIDGGHAVAGVAVLDGDIWIVSWGEPVKVTPAFVEKYLQVAIVYVSGAQLHGGETVHGLRKPDLRRALAEVTA